MFAGDELGSKPWLQPVLNIIIAAVDPPLAPTRLRPFIFVYELDSAFYTDILQVGKGGVTDHNTQAAVGDQRGDVSVGKRVVLA